MSLKIKIGGLFIFSLVLSLAALFGTISLPAHAQCQQGGQCASDSDCSGQSSSPSTCEGCEVNCGGISSSYCITGLVPCGSKGCVPSDQCVPQDCQNAGLQCCGGTSEACTADPFNICAPSSLCNTGTEYCGNAACVPVGTCNLQLCETGNGPACSFTFSGQTGGIQGTCAPQGQICGAQKSVCGDSRCDFGEIGICSSDCGTPVTGARVAVCGNGQCEYSASTNNENHNNCPADCTSDRACTTRSTWAGGPYNPSGCQQFNNDPVACNNAWQYSGGAPTGGTAPPVSCYYGTNTRNETGCFGCGATNQGANLCTNECDSTLCSSFQSSECSVPCALETQGTCDCPTCEAANRQDQPCAIDSDCGTDGACVTSQQSVHVLLNAANDWKDNFSDSRFIQRWYYYNSPQFAGAGPLTGNDCVAQGGGREDCSTFSSYQPQQFRFAKGICAAPQSSFVGITWEAFSSGAGGTGDGGLSRLVPFDICIKDLQTGTLWDTHVTRWDTPWTQPPSGAGYGQDNLNVNNVIEYTRIGTAAACDCGAPTPPPAGSLPGPSPQLPPISLTFEKTVELLPQGSATNNAGAMMLMVLIVALSLGLLLQLRKNKREIGLFILVIGSAVIISSLAFAQEVSSGESLRYSLRVHNIGSREISEAVISDQIPDQTSYVLNSLRLNGAIASDSFDNDQGEIQGTALAAHLGILAPGQTKTFSYIVSVNQNVSGTIFAPAARLQFVEAETPVLSNNLETPIKGFVPAPQPEQPPAPSPTPEVGGPPSPSMLPIPPLPPTMPPFTLLQMQADSEIIMTGDMATLRTSAGVLTCELSQNEGLTNAIRVFGTIANESVRAQIAVFTACGTQTTRHLGAGERLGVVNSFRAAFGHLPSTVADWFNVVKIANGRFPDQASATAEANAKVRFRAVYLREPVMANANDPAAVHVMAYGLRPLPRNLNSEASAIVIFRAVFHRSPVSASDWDTVRAIAYSGATR